MGTGMALFDLETQSATNIDPLPGARYLSPVLSPDGRHIAFRVYGDQMYMFDVESRTTVPLGDGHHPRWAPDGAWIVFERNKDDGHRITSSDLYVSNLSGTRQDRLTSSEDILEANPDWSPVGNRIVFDDLVSGTIRILQITRLR